MPEVTKSILKQLVSIKDSVPKYTEIRPLDFYIFASAAQRKLEFCVVAHFTSHGMSVCLTNASVRNLLYEQLDLILNGSCTSKLDNGGVQPWVENTRFLKGTLSSLQFIFY